MSSANNGPVIDGATSGRFEVLRQLAARRWKPVISLVALAAPVWKA